MRRARNESDPIAGDSWMILRNDELRSLSAHLADDVAGVRIDSYTEDHLPRSYVLADLAGMVANRAGVRRDTRNERPSRLPTKRLKDNFEHRVHAAALAGVRSHLLGRGILA